MPGNNAHNLSIIQINNLFQKAEVEKSKAGKADGSKLNCAGDGQYDSPGKRRIIITFGYAIQTTWQTLV